MKIIGKRVLIILIIFIILFGSVVPMVFADTTGTTTSGTTGATGTTGTTGTSSTSGTSSVWDGLSAASAADGGGNFGSDGGIQSSAVSGDVLSTIADFGSGILLYPVRLVIMIVAQAIETIVGVSGTNGTTVTAESILFNDQNSELTNIDFFKPAPTGSSTFVTTLRKNIAGWYYGIRTIAIIVSLAVLIYIAIRMVTASIADDKAKYKGMLKNWAVSFAIVFLLHYVIILVISGNNTLVAMLKSALGTGTSNTSTSSVIGGLFTGQVSNDGTATNSAFSNYVASIKSMAIGNLTVTTGFSAAIVWLMLEAITLAFFVMYVKRLIVTAFLIIISPLITVTYAIDKIGDGKAQAFSNWSREFIWTVLIQPFHCLIYLVFVGAAAGLLSNGNLASSIVAIMCMLFILSAEEIVKKIFGIQSSSHMGSIATGAALAAGGIMAGANFARKTTSGRLEKEKEKEKAGGAGNNIKMQEPSRITGVSDGIGIARDAGSGGGAGGGGTPGGSPSVGTSPSGGDLSTSTSTEQGSEKLSNLRQGFDNFMNSRTGKFVGGYLKKSATIGAGISGATVAAIQSNGNIDTIVGAATGAGALGGGFAEMTAKKAGAGVRYRLDKIDQKKNAPIIKKMEQARLKNEQAQLKNNLSGLSQQYQATKDAGHWQHDEKTPWTDSEIKTRAEFLMGVNLNNWESQGIRFDKGASKGQLNEEGQFAQQLQEVSKQLKDTTGDGSIENVLKHMREQGARDERDNMRDMNT
ncbi:MAG: pilin [Oscillospiraceae bacterium]|nr:pilin [Oscillospiraceae bacterium]